MIADLIHPRTWIVLLLAFAIALMMMYAAGIAIDMPMSRHATTSHANDKWNAENISATMNNGGCGPISVYVCPNDKVIMTCTSPSDPRKLLGLVTGHTDRQIITGYTSRIRHWDKKTSKCTYTGSLVTP